MNATTAGNASTNGSRPRLKPGVPAGGVTALVLIAGLTVYALVAGVDDGDERRTHRVSVDIDAPRPPMAPVPPNEGLVNAEEIRRSVADALRGIDVEAIQRDAMAAAQEAMADVEAARAEIEAARAAEAAGTGRGALDMQFTAPGGVRLVNVNADVTVRAVGRDVETVGLRVDEGAQSLRTFVTGGVLTVAGNGSARGMDIVLDIPAGSDLVLANFNGDLDLREFQGGLTADIQRGDIAAGTLSSANLRVHSNADINIGRVDGQLALEVMGRADLNVGRTGSLALELPGRSNIQVGSVDEATVISAAGRTGLQIGTVSGPVKAEFSGAGTINIDDGVSEKMDVAVLGAGSFTFNGTAVDPNLYLGGSGSIIVPNVEGTPRVQRAGTGEIRTGR